MMIVRRFAARFLIAATSMCMACSVCTELALTANSAAIPPQKLPPLKLWSVLSGTSEKGVFTVAFSPDNKFVAGGQGDGTVVIWEVVTGRMLSKLDAEADESVLATRFSGDGTKLMCIVPSGLHIWYWQTGKKLVTRRWNEMIANAEISPTQKLLATVDIRGGISLFDLEADGTEKELSTEGQFPWSLAFSPDGDTLAIGVTDGSVQLCSVKSGNQICTLHSPDRSPVRAITWTKDGNHLLTAGGREGICLWDVQARKLLKSMRQRVFPFHAIAVTRNGTTIAVGSGNGTLQLWDLESAILMQSLHAHAGLVQSLAFASDGQIVATASIDSTVRIWDSGKLVRATGVKLTPHELEKLFTRALSEDEMDSSSAILALASAPEQTLLVIRQRVPQIPECSSQEINMLIEDLDSSTYHARDQATQKLRKLGQAARQQIQQALKQKRSLEFHERAQRILQNMETAFSPDDERFLCRAAVILGRIGTPKARELLQRMAQLPNDRVLEEVRSVLQRLPNESK